MAKKTDSVWGQHTPIGTEPNPALKPEERLSWAWSILPFIEFANLYQNMDKTAAWNAPENRAGVDASLSVFQNPSQTGLRRNPSSGDYIGIAGVCPLYQSDAADD